MTATSIPGTMAIPATKTIAGTMTVTVRTMRASDAPAVLAIYQAGLDSGNASFEAVAPDWATFDARRLRDHRFVAADQATGEVLGWIAVTAYSDRPSYAGVVEQSVYVSPDAQGRGVGLALIGALVASAEESGIWTIQAGIFAENIASLRLHARAGFRVVGTRERIGRLHDRWRDVVLMERRSPLI